MYKVEQNVATLVFGNNEDDGDNQLHNGSGKSAFLECIGFGLTGEPFRKVDTVEDIIKDDEDFAEVTLSLSNAETGKAMSIMRRIERGQSQKVEVTVSEGGSETKIPYVSVLETNRQVLELLGITKDDLYHNYLLNSNRFKSFFSSTDREKKEIINTFSNGIMVDDAINAMEPDFREAESALMDAEMKLSEVNGRINGYRTQIDTAMERAEETEAGRKERIERHKADIANWRGLIRDRKEEIERVGKSIAEIDCDADKIDSLRNLENLTFEGAIETIAPMMEKAGLSGKMSDWKARVAQYSDTLASMRSEYSALLAGTEEFRKDIFAAGVRLDGSRKEYEENCKKLDSQDAQDRKEREEIVCDIEKYSKKLAELKEKVAGKNGEIYELEAKIRKVEAQISGSVECPECHHRFVLDNDRTSVDDLVAVGDGYRSEIDVLRSELSDADSERNKVGKYVSDCQLDLDDIDADIRKRKAARDEYWSRLRGFEVEYGKLKSELEMRYSKCSQMSSRIGVIEDSIAKATGDMIDESVDIMDAAIRDMETARESMKQQIRMYEESISACNEAIAKIEESTVEDMIEQVKAHLRDAEEDRVAAESRRSECRKVLDDLKEQESIFVGFKTHLANTKISSIAQITNQVLKDVGSPLRVHLSGFTVTKTGKVRDKISISVSRDGMDCGSFLKCSAGERARIMFANIVAMQRMTNIAANGNGLNLLCLDEIMDSCDESGLASVAEIANELGITVIMITQGKTSESYPHQLTVTKRCGVSMIGD